MKRSILFLALLLVAGCSPVQPVATAFKGPLRSSSIELPADEARFAGVADADLLNANCLACHSTTMVLSQPKLNAARWGEVVRKMRDAYHAPIEEAEIPALTRALVAVQSAPPG